MAITLKTVIGTLKRKYNVNSGTLNSVASTIYNNYLDLSNFVGGAYVQAFDSARNRGLISLKADLSERTSTQEQRQRLATTFRTMPQHLLRRIADAYEDASRLVNTHLADPEQAIGTAFVRQGLREMHFGKAALSYRQARVVYELVRKGEYGGLDNEGKTTKSLVLPGKIDTFQRPGEVVLRAEAASASDMDRYIQEYDARVFRDAE